MKTSTSELSQEKQSFNGNHSTDYVKVLDFVKIGAWNKLLDNQPSQIDTIDQVIPSAMADACTTRYQNIYAKPIDPANYSIIENAYTCSMSFGSKSLSDWALDIVNNTNAVKIEVRLGLYTGDIVIRFGLQEDRLTAFLYPIDGSGNLAKYLDRSGSTMTVSANDAPTYDLAGLKP